MPPARPQFRVLDVALHVLPMRTRFPFRYGIASMTVVPHLFVTVELELDGTTTHGISADGLPPKWFTKNPRTTHAQDIGEMLTDIQNAARVAPLVTKAAPLSFFAFWQQIQKEHGQWAFKQAHPPLLWQFGASLIERAVLDALCRLLGQPLHEVIKTNLLGIDWGLVHPGLEDHTAVDFLPPSPLDSVSARHTIGLSDPLRNADILPSEAVLDGLPYALEDVIPAYGLRYFKIKLGGDANHDTARLAVLTEVLLQHCGSDFHITLDGNEAFRDVPAFCAYYQRLQKDAALAPLLQRLLWVEQPVHRDRALVDSVATDLNTWTDAPALIIDESDGGSGDSHRALRLGYSGVSHKNCKGIVKGLANAALVHHHRRLRPKKTFILSGEDLVNAGPVALTQDLAMMALLGIQHVERNGHHYYRGLTPFPDPIPAETLKAHPDLFGKNAHGLPSLRIQQGQIALGSVNAAPFGAATFPDVSALPTVKAWLAQGGPESCG